MISKLFLKISTKYTTKPRHTVEKTTFYKRRRDHDEGVFENVAEQQNVNARNAIAVAQFFPFCKPQTCLFLFSFHSSHACITIYNAMRALNYRAEAETHLQMQPITKSDHRLTNQTNIRIPVNILISLYKPCFVHMLFHIISPKMLKMYANYVLCSIQEMPK